MKKIILDTNFLMIPFQFNIDIFAEINRICNFSYKIYVLDKTIDELKRIIKEQRGKHKRAASLALQLLKAKKVSIIKTKIIKTKKHESVDDLIVETVNKEYIVATQDAALKRRIKKKAAKIITMRQKKFLKIIT